MNMNKILSILLLAGAVLTAQAEVKLPQILSSGMVVQQNRPLTLWGTADPGETVKIVVPGRRQNSALVHADSLGKWKVYLPSLPVGKPYTVRINDIVLEDVLVGDVLLCSGQSNMELPVSRVMDLLHEDIEGYSNPSIRQFRVPNVTEFGEPLADIGGTAKWQSVDEAAQSFSAVAYYTARELNARTGLPIGLVCASWGGTPVESWISEEYLAPYPLYLNKKHVYDDAAYRDQLKEQEWRNYQHWDGTLRASDPGLQGEKWYSPSLDDSDWQTIDFVDDPSWGTDGMNPRNGSHWLRRHVRIDKSHAGKPATLRLGCIVDADSAWVNGTFVGNTTYQYPPRIYDIPAGVLKEGDNVVTVQVISQHGFPHIVPEKPHKILFGERYAVWGKKNADEISLEGPWLYRQGSPMPEGPDMMFYCYLPAVLYNGMIAPVIQYPVSGAVWYQGEANVVRSNQYPALLETMIKNWRDASGNEEMPFYIIELADFLHPADKAGRDAWQAMRERQAQVCNETPGATLIHNSDLGEWNDIHPLDKKTLGTRVAEAIINGKLKMEN